MVTAILRLQDRVSILPTLKKNPELSPRFGCLQKKGVVTVQDETIAIVEL